MGDRICSRRLGSVHPLVHPLDGMRGGSMRSGHGLPLHRPGRVRTRRLLAVAMVNDRAVHAGAGGVQR